MFPNSITRPARAAAMARHQDLQELGNLARVSNVALACFLSLELGYYSHDNVTLKVIVNQQDSKKWNFVWLNLSLSHQRMFYMQKMSREVPLPLRWDTLIYLFSLYLNNIIYRLLSKGHIWIILCVYTHFLEYNCLNHW